MSDRAGEKFRAATLQRFEEAILASVKMKKAGTLDRDVPFDAAIFYNHWFEASGKARFFLFRKSLKITNIQIAELVSLIRIYCHLTTEDIDPGLNGLHYSVQLASAGEFKDQITRLFEDFGPSNLKQIKEFCKLYQRTLVRYVVLNGYFTSASLYLPSHLDIDLKTLCAESGYIHSCGHLVYVRNINKSDSLDLIANINKHLSRHPKSPAERMLFAVYCHEDFTEYDRIQRERLEFGLDGVKIYQRKAMFGNATLVQALRHIKKEYQGVLDVPEPGDYRNSDRKSSRTLWMLTDSSFDHNSKFPGDSRFYIVYDQTYYNSDPFFIFDEDKPAWHSPTTLPHTLTAAMINITRREPESPGDGSRDPELRYDLIDPFGGSGTTYFEARKFVHVAGMTSDRDEMADLVFRDNLEFFGLEVDELRDCYRDLVLVLRKQDPERKFWAGKELAIDTTDNDRGRDDLAIYSERASGYFDTVLEFWDASGADNQSGDLQMSRGDLITIKRMSLIERLIFYTFCRSDVRNMAAFERGLDSLSGFCRELSATCRRIRDYIVLLDRCGTSLTTNRRVVTAPSNYSHCCFVNPHFGRSDLLLTEAQMIGSTVGSVEELFTGGAKFDLIVTDPPYGFNVTVDRQALSKLAYRFVFEAVGSLKKGGQLVFCCPEESYSGRTVPACWDPGYVGQLIHIAAESSGRRVIRPVHSLPAEYSHVRAPYYWEAPNTLRRRVLHFVFD